VHILDATDIGAGPVATVHLPRRVPFGFHGSWLPA
jgi:carotenoid cleavage dioxygenase